MLCDDEIADVFLLASERVNPTRDIQRRLIRDYTGNFFQNDHYDVKTDLMWTIVVSDYFVYLPGNRLCEAWGCTAISAGYTEISPNSIYPPQRHPDDHHLDWRNGRILQAYQVVFISAGQGTFEFGPDRARLRIGAGDVFLLFPGVWHRYEPDTASGWTENWIECRGAAYDDLMEQGLLSSERPIIPSNGQIADLFARIHQLARENASFNQALLSTLALELLVHLVRPKEETSRKLACIVDQIRMYIMDNCKENLAAEDLAKRFGISYSYLRRLFREQTGASIKQFQLNIKLQRSCDLLTNTNKSIKVIAAILGFANTFHFSKFFSKQQGVSPTEWRRRTRRGLYSGLNR